jgi:hypothetical protein
MLEITKFGLFFYLKTASADVALFEKPVAF